ncbi:TIGR03943 family putative permease subunit [Streptomyces sp. TRM64462]|uniref:TIGR03943 family putative permease subunit n=1 Tax=Streptomyces sp. TRM64462 TaxID=2741726 RepID=UPI001585F779|nr:TIGR03943 family protein [Streptomyces sp. TRM64462]
MRRVASALLLLLSGAGVLRISLFGDVYLRYVKEGLQPLLVVSGCVLVAAGLAGAVRDVWAGRRGSDTRGDADGDAEADGDAQAHGHGHGPRVAWLLALPALAMLFFAPPALGSYTAARDDAKAVEAYDRFDPLPSGDPVPLSLTDFIARAQQDEQRGLEGRTVLLEGFVTPGGGGGWRVSRLVMSCCAADARSLTVAAYGAEAPPADTWVRVTGTWHAPGAALDVATVERIPQPPVPYADRTPDLNR